jgi:hypothetical protein
MRKEGGGSQAEAADRCGWVGGWVGGGVVGREGCQRQVQQTAGQRQERPGGNGREAPA